LRAAHLRVQLQLPTHGGPFRAAKNQTALVIAQLRAAHPRRLAQRHAWNRGADGGRDTTGGAAAAARKSHARMLTRDKPVLSRALALWLRQWL